MDASTPYPDTLAPNARAVFAELCRSLPKASDDSDEVVAARLRKAMDAVFALHPEDQFETDLATRIVTMHAHAMDALYAAAEAVDDPEKQRQRRAQAASMARQSDAALSKLRRMQRERDKAFNEMHPATMGRAGYWFREVSVPAPDAVPGPDPDAVPGPAPDRPRAGGDPRPGTPRPAAPPAAEAEPPPSPADIEADVKLYAAMYPDRVRRIRAAGGLPADLDFGPPEPEIVDALLRGVGGADAVPPRATRSNGAGH